MKNDFEKYKNVAQKIAVILIENNCTGCKDIDIIYNILLGTPYAYEDGCIWNSEFFKNATCMPEEGRIELCLKYGQRNNAVPSYVRNIKNNLKNQ